MDLFSNVEKEAMVKYMDAFIELASLVPEIEETDIAALGNLSRYVKDGCYLAPEVAYGYRAVYDRVYDMIFTESVKHTPYTRPYKGVYQHRVDYKTLRKATSRRDGVLYNLVFNTYEGAENFYNTLIEYVSEYGAIAVGDVVDEYEKTYDTNDYTPTFYDYRFGWTNLPSKSDDVIVRDSGSWRVVLPKPAALNINFKEEN